jgi:hypothetical protein
MKMSKGHVNVILNICDYEDILKIALIRYKLTWLSTT